MKKLFCLLILASFALPSFAQTKALLNIDKAGTAIQGYDPVAFFTDNKPLKGKTEFASQHSAVTALTAFHPINSSRLTWTPFKSSMVT